MADVAILQQQVEPTPDGYTIPGAQEIIIKSIKASFDGSGAGGPWIPVLQFVAPNGFISTECPYTGDPLASGALADVSWFRGGGTVATAGGYAYTSAVRLTPITGLFNSTLDWQGIVSEGSVAWTLGVDNETWTCATSGTYQLEVELHYVSNHLAGGASGPLANLIATVADPLSPIRNNYTGEFGWWLGAGGSTAGTYSNVPAWTLPNLAFTAGDHFQIVLFNADTGGDTIDVSNCTITITTV